MGMMDWVALQARLEEAAAAVKATTTAVRNRNKFTVPDEIREMAGTGGKMQGPSETEVAAEARREFEAGRAVLPGGKVIHRQVVTKLWINGHASEEKDESAEEVRAHCERCYDDKTETSEVQDERIRHQRSRGDSLAALQGRHVQITVDRVLRARGKMMKNKANGPADCLVTECLPTETAYEVTHWFKKRFQGECRVPKAWNSWACASQEARRPA